MHEVKKESDIKTCLDEFYDKIKEDPQHRFRSWEHCYKYFQSIEKPGFDEEKAALHLAFFLASWGMYRGSSSVLWKDYTIHKPAIQYLFDSKDRIQKIRSLKDSYRKDEKAQAEDIRTIIEEVKAVQNLYTENLKTSVIKGKERKEFVSVMFVSKLLLATYACIPAFDSFVCKSMGRSSSSQINENTLRYVYNFASLNEKDLLAKKERIEKECGCEQPMMKLVDAYLWIKGQKAKEKS
ncbi:hypothetical protein H0R92_08725 [Treponema sp. OMZ 840]|uniref:hypothetical protein n=1 Tax=Treponema sp. OMZ 840 TaxID=244313 RepID=UPI003D8D6CDB